MSDRIDTIVSSINSAISAGTSYTDNLLGVAKIHDLENKKYPAIWDTSKWNEIALDTSYDLQIYHRITGISHENNDEFDFGPSKEPNQRNYSMLMTVIFSKSYEEDELEEIIGLIPRDITDASYAFVTVNIGGVNTNQDEVIESEWGALDYTKHKSSFNIYQVGYEVELITC